jgi:hypothetical protein
MTEQIIFYNMYFYLVQVLTVWDTRGVVKGDTVMTEQTKLLAEAIEKALGIIEQNLSNTIDAKFDALDLDGQVLSEARVRTLAREEADDAIDDASLEVEASISSR